MPLRRYEAPSFTSWLEECDVKKSTHKYKYYYLIKAAIMTTIITMVNNNKWQKEIVQNPMRQQTVLGIREPTLQKASQTRRLKQWAGTKDMRKRCVHEAAALMCGRWSDGRKMRSSIQNQLIMIRITNAYKLNSTVAMTVDFQRSNVVIAL